MFDKLKHIATGWGKYAGLLATSEEEKTLSIARMQICSICEFAKESRLLEFFAHGAEDIDTIVCGQCHCPCHQKSLTNEMCPIGRWDNLLTTNKTATI